MLDGLAPSRPRRVGIEAMNAFVGSACLDVHELAVHRGLDMARFENLLMREKTVALPCEDPVSFAVNAARPLVDALGPDGAQRIEAVITCTESSFDFGKSLSTYVHHWLGLSRNCRLFELKNACYSGVAGLQTAVNQVLAQCSPGAKVLVVATDISRFLLGEGADACAQEWAFAEPSGGAGAVAMLVSDEPRVMQIDVGANGYYGYEVMDTCRPQADSETGDADLSLLSYLDCCENAFLEYRRRVPEADYAQSFGLLAFHTPFGGMVKGAHRSMMRKLAGARPPAIDQDFSRRVEPGLAYCRRVGNIMGATAMLSLLSTIDNAPLDRPTRVGVFSYGSGCCSEFFSGVVTPDSQRALRAQGLGERLDARYRLSMAEYEMTLRRSADVRFGTRDVRLDEDLIPAARRVHRRPVLFLKAINAYHREYEWVS